MLERKERKEQKGKERKRKEKERKAALTSDKIEGRRTKDPKQRKDHPHVLA